MGRDEHLKPVMVTLGAGFSRVESSIVVDLSVGGASAPFVSQAVAACTRIGQGREGVLPFPPPRRDGKLSLAALYRTAGLSVFRAQPKWTVDSSARVRGEKGRERGKNLAFESRLQSTT